MKIVYFTHSLRSCWNHGNAHFLRGILRELTKEGHDVVAREPEGSWSLKNLLAEHEADGLQAYQRAYPELRAESYAEYADMAELCDGANLVIVHEWNDPALVAAIGKCRRQANFTLLFHDTHHRAVSDPDAINAFDLSCYDGVLAFGETLAAIYRRWGWGDRVWVWHEAADTSLFKPPAQEISREGLVWIGNWGDGERSAELEEFLLDPAQSRGFPLDIYGVRYAKSARELLTQYGARYRGWLPNALAPQIFARHSATVHVPRHFYVSALPGIPTIRVFEALACGIPLLSAPWTDSEHLFQSGEDYLVAENGDVMRRNMAALFADADLRKSLAAHGLATILARHSCAHRVVELMDIVQKLSPKLLETARCA
jgi:spore maturation protein CgeB